MNFKITANFNGGIVAAKLEQAITRGLQHTGQAVMKDMSDSLGKRANGKPSAPGSPPNNQRGQLQQKFGVATSGRVSRVANTAPYARIQELGGTVRAKNAKFLWIPVNAKRSETPTNIVSSMISGQRKGIRNLAQGKGGGSPYQMIPRRKLGRKNGWIVVRKSKSGRSVMNGLLYVLLKQVHLPERPYMRPSLRRMEPKLAGIFAAAAGKHFMAGVTQ